MKGLTPGILSAIVGGVFFALPYLALSVPFWPSLVIGLIAFGAGELIFTAIGKDELKVTNKTIQEKIADAKEINNKIVKMAPKIEKESMKQDILKIHDTVGKIISTAEKSNKKAKKLNNFFDYYLPVTLNIITKYDEIENQRLTTQEGYKFMQDGEQMISKMSQAYQNLLSNLYQSDMVDTGAEMKVIDTMLSADGYDVKNDFNIEKRVEKTSQE